VIGYDCIVLAGDKGGSRLINGENKAFLLIEGVPVINYVLSALENVDRILNIYVVGPKKRLEDAIAFKNNPFKGKKNFEIFEQHENLIENIWYTFLRTIPGGMDSLPEEFIGTPFEEKAILIVPSDIPLVCHFEIDEFIDQCDTENFDYIIGITSEKVLKAYYPRKRRRGIRLMYYHFRGESVRQNNLHMVKPLKIANRFYIQKLYDFRHQREWMNIIRLGWEIFRTEEGTLKILGHFILLHISNFFYRMRLLKLHRVSRWFLVQKNLEESVSNLLKARFTSVKTHYGGAALDIDTPEQYAIIKENFRRWREFQLRLALRRRKNDFIIKLGSPSYMDMR
jgi:molybdopterin-guanine dinucleotide biosynthesis protein A